ncbi:hypothetical protein ACFL1T_02370, partial [Chlamydiota bacterium]
MEKFATTTQTTFKTFFLKGVSLSLVITIIFSTIGIDLTRDLFASPLSISHINQIHDLSFPNRLFENMNLLGMQKGKTYRGSENIQFYLIRDIHGNEEAQQRIAQTIKQLRSKENVSTVFIEGAEGNLNSRLFESFPVDEIRKAVAKEFLKKGYLTGAEYAVISLGDNALVDVYGVEDAALYIENLKQFKKVRDLLEENKSSLQQITLFIETLKKSHFSQDLQQIDKLFQIITGGENVVLEEIVKTLTSIIDRIDKTRVDFSVLKDISELERFIQLVKREKKFDKEKAHDELLHITKELEKGLVKEELQILVKKSLEFRIGKITDGMYLNYVKEIYQETMGDSDAFQENYSLLNNWLLLAHERDTIDCDQLWNVIKESVIFLRGRYRETEEFTDIITLSDQWFFLKRLVELKMTHEEMHEVSKLDADNTVKELADQMKTLVSSRKKGLFAIPFQSKLEVLITAAIEFYSLATKRDLVLVKNALGKMQSAKSKEKKGKFEIRNQKSETNVKIQNSKQTIKTKNQDTRYKGLKNKNQETRSTKYEIRNKHEARNIKFETHQRRSSNKFEVQDNSAIPLKAGQVRNPAEGRTSPNFEIQNNSTIRNPQSAILITGGFHTEGIQTLLEEHNISYVTLTPILKEEITTDFYEHRMIELAQDLEGEFSREKRFFLAQDSMAIRMLSIPVGLNVIFQMINEERFDELALSMLEDMVSQAVASDKKIAQEVKREINDILNQWLFLGELEKQSVLEKISLEDTKKLVRTISTLFPEDIPLILSELDASSPIQAELTLKTIEAALSEEYRGFKELVKYYFGRVNDEQERYLLDYGRFLKAPGSPRLSPEECDFIESSIEELNPTLINKKIIKNKIYNCVKWCNERIRIPNNESPITTSQIKIYTIPVIYDGKSLLGFPRFNGAFAAKDLVYAYSKKDLDGKLCIYVTREFWNNRLSGNRIANRYLFSEVIDHEWFEIMEAPSLAISEDEYHQFASRRACFFGPSKIGVSKFHEFIISTFHAENDIDHLITLMTQHQNDPEKKFLNYVKIKLLPVLVKTIFEEYDQKNSVTPLTFEKSKQILLARGVKTNFEKEIRPLMKPKLEKEYTPIHCSGKDIGFFPDSRIRYLIGEGIIVPGLFADEEIKKSSFALYRKKKKKAEYVLVSAVEEYFVETVLYGFKELMTKKMFDLFVRAYENAAAYHGSNSPALKRAIRCATAIGQLEDLKIKPEITFAALLLEVPEDNRKVFYTKVAQDKAVRIEEWLTNVEEILEIKEKLSKSFSQEKQRNEYFVNDYKDMIISLAKAPEVLELLISYFLAKISSSEKDETINFEELVYVWAGLAGDLNMLIEKIGMRGELTQEEVEYVIKDIAFKYFYPEEEQSIIDEIQTSFNIKYNEDLHTYAQQVLPKEIKEELIKSGVAEKDIMEVKGSLKGPYAIARKIKHRKKKGEGQYEIGKLDDLIRCRLIVPSVEAAYNLINTSLFDDRIDYEDYIYGIQRETGYKSLHMVIPWLLPDEICTHGDCETLHIEVQIRTPKMDAIAVFGEASNRIYELNVVGQLVEFQNGIGEVRGKFHEEFFKMKENVERKKRRIYVIYERKKEEEYTVVPLSYKLKQPVLFDFIASPIISETYDEFVRLIEDFAFTSMERDSHLSLIYQLKNVEIIRSRRKGRAKNARIQTYLQEHIATYRGVYFLYKRLLSTDANFKQAFDAIIKEGQKKFKKWDHGLFWNFVVKDKKVKKDRRLHVERVVRALGTNMNDYKNMIYFLLGSKTINIRKEEFCELVQSLIRPGWRLGYKKKKIECMSAVVKDGLPFPEQVSLYDSLKNKKLAFTLKKGVVRFRRNNTLTILERALGIATEDQRKALYQQLNAVILSRERLKKRGKKNLSSKKEFTLHFTDASIDPSYQSLFGNHIQDGQLFCNIRGLLSIKKEHRSALFFVGFSHELVHELTGKGIEIEGELTQEDAKLLIELIENTSDFAVNFSDVVTGDLVTDLIISIGEKSLLDNEQSILMRSVLVELSLHGKLQDDLLMKKVHYYAVKACLETIGVAESFESLNNLKITPEDLPLVEDMFEKNDGEDDHSILKRKRILSLLQPETALIEWSIEALLTHALKDPSKKVRIQAIESLQEILAQKKSLEKNTIRSLFLLLEDEFHEPLVLSLFDTLMGEDPDMILHALNLDFETGFLIDATDTMRFFTILLKGLERSNIGKAFYIKILGAIASLRHDDGTYKLPEEHVHYIVLELIRNVLNTDMLVRHNACLYLGEIAFIEEINDCVEALQEALFYEFNPIFRSELVKVLGRLASLLDKKDSLRIKAEESIASVAQRRRRLTVGRKWSVILRDRKQLSARLNLLFEEGRVQKVGFKNVSGVQIDALQIGDSISFQQYSASQGTLLISGKEQQSRVPVLISGVPSAKRKLLIFSLAGFAFFLVLDAVEKQVRPLEKESLFTARLSEIIIKPSEKQKSIGVDYFVDVLSEDENVRVRAVKSLGALSSDEIFKFLSDPSIKVRRAVLESMKKNHYYRHYSNKKRKIVRMLFQIEDPRIKMEAIDILSRQTQFSLDSWNRIDTPFFQYSWLIHRGIRAFFYFSYNWLIRVINYIYQKNVLSLKQNNLFQELRQFLQKVLFFVDEFYVQHEMDYALQKQRFDGLVPGLIDRINKPLDKTINGQSRHDLFELIRSFYKKFGIGFYSDPIRNVRGGSLSNRIMLNEKNIFFQDIFSVLQHEVIHRINKGIKLSLSLTRELDEVSAYIEFIIAIKNYERLLINEENDDLKEYLRLRIYGLKRNLIRLTDFYNGFNSIVDSYIKRLISVDVSKHNWIEQFNNVLREMGNTYKIMFHEIKKEEVGVAVRSQSQLVRTVIKRLNPILNEYRASMIADLPYYDEVINGIIQLEKTAFTVSIERMNRLLTEDLIARLIEWFVIRLPQEEIEKAVAIINEVYSEYQYDFDDIRSPVDWETLWIEATRRVGALFPQNTSLKHGSLSLFARKYGVLKPVPPLSKDKGDSIHHLSAEVSGDISQTETDQDGKKLSADSTDEDPSVSHSEGFMVQWGREGLWVNGEDIALGDGVEQRKIRITKQKKSNADVVVGEKSVFLSPKLQNILSKNKLKQKWLKEFIKDQINKSPPIQDTLYIDLLDDSSHLFEDCTANGYIGINKRLFELKNPQLITKLLKIGIAHEMKHEAGTEKSEDELLLEDVIASVKVGITRKEIKQLEDIGILDKQSTFFLERLKLEVLWYLHAHLSDYQKIALVIAQVYARLPWSKKEEGLDLIKKYSLQQAQRIKDKNKREKVLSGIYQAIAQLYQDETNRDAAIKKITDEALNPTLKMNDQHSIRSIALGIIYLKIAVLYSREPDTEKVLDSIQQKALIPLMKIKKRLYVDKRLVGVCQLIAEICSSVEDKRLLEKALAIIKKVVSHVASEKPSYGENILRSIQKTEEEISEMLSPEKRLPDLVSAQTSKKQIRQIQDESDVHEIIAQLQSQYSESRVLSHIEKKVLQPVLAMPNNTRKADFLRAISRSIVTVFQEYSDKRKVVRFIKNKLIKPFERMGLEEWVLNRMLLTFYNGIVYLYKKDHDTKEVLRVIKEEVLTPIIEMQDVPGFARHDGLISLIQRTSQIVGNPETLMFVLELSTVLTPLFRHDSFVRISRDERNYVFDQTGNYDFYSIPEVTEAFLLSRDRVVHLRNMFLRNKIVQNKYSLEEKVSALLLNNMSLLYSFISSRVKTYADENHPYIIPELLALDEREEAGYTVEVLLNDSGEKQVAVNKIRAIVEKRGFIVDEEGYIYPPLSQVSSVFQIGNGRFFESKRNLSHSVTTVICNYGIDSIEDIDRFDLARIQNNNDSILHEVDYSLLCYEGRQGVKNEYIPLGIEYKEGIPLYAYKRTTDIKNKSVLDILKEVEEIQKKERIYEDTILTIFEELSKGGFKKDELNTVVQELKKNINGLKKIVNPLYFTMLYAYLDEEFYQGLIAQYKEAEDNEHEIKKLIWRAKQRKGRLRIRSKLWEKKKLNLLDYLRFKRNMRRGTYEEKLSLDEEKTRHMSAQVNENLPIPGNQETFNKLKGKSIQFKLINGAIHVDYKKNETLKIFENALGVRTVDERKKLYQQLSYIIQNREKIKGFIKEDLPSSYEFTLYFDDDLTDSSYQSLFGNHIRDNKIFCNIRAFLNFKRAYRRAVFLTGMSHEIVHEVLPNTEQTITKITMLEKQLIEEDALILTYLIKKRELFLQNCEMITSGYLIDRLKQLLGKKDRYSWEIDEVAVRNVEQSLRENRPDIMERFDRLDELSPVEKEALREDIYEISSGDCKLWGLQSIFSKEKVPLFNASHITALLGLFLALDLKPLGFYLDWSSRDRIIRSVLFVLSKEVPDIIDRYEQLDKLSKIQREKLKKDIYALSESHFAAWGIGNSFSGPGEWKFTSFIEVLQSVFPQLELNTFGFKSDWSTKERAIQYIRYILLQKMPHIIENYDRLDELTLFQKKQLQKDIYALKQAHFAHWGLGSIQVREAVPYFSGSYKDALCAVFPELKLNKLGFGLDWSTEKMSIASITFVLKREIPEVMALFDKIDTLSTRDILRLKERIYALSTAYFYKWKLSSALTEHAVPYFKGKLITVLQEVFKHKKLTLTEGELV